MKHIINVHTYHTITLIGSTLDKGLLQVYSIGKQYCLAGPQGFCATGSQQDHCPQDHCRMGKFKAAEE